VTSMASVVVWACVLRHSVMLAGRHMGNCGSRLVGSINMSNLLWVTPAIELMVDSIVWRVLRMEL
jgi:hypothetical protein